MGTNWVEIAEASDPLGVRSTGVQIMQHLLHSGLGVAVWVKQQRGFWQIGSWIETLNGNATLLLEASKIKALHRLSVADAWIDATALPSRAALLNKDLEFEAITELDQSWLA